MTTEAHLLALPRELRDLVLEYVLRDFHNTDSTCADPNAAVRNGLLLTCHQIRAETLQRIKSLQLAPVLEVITSSVWGYAAIWTVPPLEAQDGGVCKRAVINLRYLQPTNYEAWEIGGYRTRDRCNLPSVVMATVGKLLKAGYVSIGEVHVNLFLPEPRRCNLNHVLRSMTRFRDGMYAEMLRNNVKELWLIHLGELKHDYMGLVRLMENAREWKESQIQLKHWSEP